MHFAWLIASESSVTKAPRLGFEPEARRMGASLIKYQKRREAPRLGFEPRRAVKPTT
jgi:hypothetical protein